MTTPTVTRWTGGPDPDTLLAAYRLATEAEKGAPVAGVANLPSRHTRLGFAEVASWDDRRDLVCLRRGV